MGLLEILENFQKEIIEEMDGFYDTFKVLQEGLDEVEDHIIYKEVQV